MATPLNSKALRDIAGHLTRHPRLVLGAVFAAYVISLMLWSAKYAIFRWDGMHWGSILTHSLSLCEGRVPYTEVPIYYGPLPFYLHCALGSLIEFSYLVAGLATAVALAINIGFCILIGRRLGLRTASIVTFIGLAAFLHPFVVYPWYDYLAGAFFTAGIYFLLRCKPANIAAELLCAACFSCCLLTRYTGLPIVLVTILLLAFVIPVSRLSLVRIALFALGIAAAFLLAMYLRYGLTPVVIVGQIVDGYTLLSGLQTFSVLRPFRPPYTATNLFSAAFLLGLVYYASRLLTGARDNVIKIEATLFLVGALNMFINSAHVFEFFRLISNSPLMLLLGIDIGFRAGASIATLGWRRQPLTNMVAIALVIPVLAILGLSASQYPYASANHRIAPQVASLSGLFAQHRVGKVAGVTHYDVEQFDFYGKIHELCDLRKNLINVSGDVMAARTCITRHMIMFDGMPETYTLLMKKHPDTFKRAVEQADLTDDEIMISYDVPAPFVQNVKYLYRFPNNRADIYAIPITVTVKATK